jgi:hypothetical protein
MSKAHHKGAARKHSPRASGGRKGPPDGAVYIGLIMIGAFGVWLWSLVSFQDDNAWKHGTLVYVIAVLALVNLFTWHVYFGKRLAPWKQSLARLPLRLTGYGTRRGRPLEAAHGSRSAGIMLILTMATSVVVIAALFWLLYMG